MFSLSTSNPRAFDLQAPVICWNKRFSTTVMEPCLLVLVLGSIRRFHRPRLQTLRVATILYYTCPSQESFEALSRRNPNRGVSLVFGYFYFFLVAPHPAAVVVEVLVLKC